MKGPGFFEGDFARCFIGSKRDLFAAHARHPSQKIKEYSLMK